MKLDIDDDSAKVNIPPPFILLACVTLSSLISLFIHAKLGIDNTEYRIFFGSLFFFVGIGCVIFCAKIFKAHNTKIQPWKTTSTIITKGPYQFSRNPIYLSFQIILSSFAFFFNSIIPLLFIPLLFFLLSKLVIEKEEHYLKNKFGKIYLDYCEKVNRWI